MAGFVESIVEKAAEHLVHEIVNHGGHHLSQHLGHELAEIVHAHALTGAAAAVASGWIPGAGAVIATVVAGGAVWTMYGRINGHLDIPFSENLVKSLATGVATNLAGYFIGGAVVSTLLSFIPGIGSVGASLIVGATGYALTVASGVVYLHVLAILAQTDPTFTHTSAGDLMRVAEQVIKQLDIKSLIEAAKAEFTTKNKS